MHVKEALIYFVFLKNNSVYLSFSVFCSSEAKGLNEQNGGDNRDRTDDPLLAKQVLSQLSYTPSSKILASASQLQKNFLR